MSISKFRIPRLTAAVLLLGGAACGDDTANKSGRDGGESDDDTDSGAGNGEGGTEGSSHEDIDLSKVRIEAVNSAYCLHYAACYAAEFTDHYDSQADCVAANARYVAEYIDAYGEDCIDALLDALECSNELECNEDPAEKCLTEGEAVVDRCPEEFFMGLGGERSSKSAAPRPDRRHGLRIPR